MLNENNLKNFENLVISQAKKEKQDVLDALKLQRDEKLKEYKKELEIKFNDKLNHETGRIENSASEKVAAKALENKKQYLLERERYMSDIFSNVKERLLQYVKTDDYINDMDKKLSSVILDNGHNYTVLINENDKKLIDFAKSKGYNTQLTHKNFIGGARVIDNTAKTLFDFTFINAAEAEENEFLEKYFKLN